MPRSRRDVIKFCLNPNLPDVVEPVVLKALAKEPRVRYGTAGDVVEALAQACNSDTSE